MIKYIDYLELEKQTNQEQKLHVDLVSKRKKYGEFKNRKIDFILKYNITNKTELTTDLIEKARREIGYSIKTGSTDIRSAIRTFAEINIF